jgi:hypothetical protein
LEVEEVEILSGNAQAILETIFRLYLALTNAAVEGDSSAGFLATSRRLDGDMTDSTFQRWVIFQLDEPTLNANQHKALNSQIS